MAYMNSLRKEIIEMWTLVISQHQKCLAALKDFDTDLAREIILIEERINSSEQLIDSDCENLISHQTFHPIKIPFIMLILKINPQLEQIGGLAKEVAVDILSSQTRFSSQLLKESKVEELYQLSQKILSLALDSFKKQDQSIAQIILNRVEVFEDLNLNNKPLFVSYLKTHIDETQNVLNLFSIIKILERTVSQTKCLAEEIIVYEKAKESESFVIN